MDCLGQGNDPVHAGARSRMRATPASSGADGRFPVRRLRRARP